VESEAPEPRIERVSDPDDPRLRDFTHLRDVQLRSQREPDEGFFLAEGVKTIDRALSAGYRPRAFLVTERWLPSVSEPAGRSDAPVLLVDDELMDRTTGFHVHRGALASMHRRALPDLDEILKGTSRVVVLEDLSDHTNLGAIFRSAAALGFDAVLLTPRCADPLYRRAVRTSMGAVFSVPWTRIPWYEGPDLLRGKGFELAALTPVPDALALTAVDPAAHARLALALGSEGHGLSDRWLGAADLRVRIPMGNGIDSLNVGAAAAVAFYALATRGPHPPPGR
jgi:tRNA G18 (ribose-2'-O)-methylase SpoU